MGNQSESISQSSIKHDHLHLLKLIYLEELFKFWKLY